MLLLRMRQTEATTVEGVVIAAAARVRRCHQERVQGRTDLSITTEAHANLDTHIRDLLLSIMDRIPVISVVAAQAVGGVHGESLVLGKFLFTMINGRKRDYLFLSSTQ